MISMMNRRGFLKTSLALSVLPLGGCTFDFFGQNKGVAIGSGKFIQKGQVIHVLSLLDMNQFNQAPKYIPIRFFAHGIAQNPKNNSILTLFEKKGPGACEVDIKNNRVLRMIETKSNRYFYGHSAYSKDGNTLFSTEAFFKGEDGLIAIRDNKTMKIMGEFPSYGKAPHDLKIIDNGKTLVVTNGGGKKGDLSKNAKPNVAYIDIASQKLKETVEFPNENINAGHLTISSKMDLIVVSAPRSGKIEDLGGISFRPQGKSILTAKHPAEIIKKLKAESLSIALHEEKQIAAVTNPDGNILTFWDYKTAKFLKSIEIDTPRSLGVTLDKKHFVLGYGKTANFSLINAETLEFEKEFQKLGAGFSGSHLLII